MAERKGNEETAEETITKIVTIVDEIKTAYERGDLRQYLLETRRAVTDLDNPNWLIYSKALLTLDQKLKLGQENITAEEIWTTAIRIHFALGKPKT